jgi:hypothetical protein
MKLRAPEVSRPSRTVSEMERQAAAIAVSLVNCEKSGPPSRKKRVGRAADGNSCGNRGAANQLIWDNGMIRLPIAAVLGS